MKKLLTLALVMVLALSLLTACNGNSNTPSGGGNNTPSGNNSTPGGNDNTPSGNNNNENNNPTSTPGGSDKQDNKPFTVDKSAFSAGDTIKVSVKDITQEMINNGAFIGIYRAGAANDDCLFQAWVEKPGSHVVEIYSPDEDGNYEVRLFKENSIETSAILHTIPFTVGNATQQGSTDTPATSTPGGNDNPTSTPSGNNGGNNNGDTTGYPPEWPNEIPKLDGKVIDSALLSDGQHTYGSVTLESINRNAVDSYISTVKSKGYEVESEGEPAVGVYYCELSNGVYYVGISFTASNNQAIIALSKPQ